MASPTNPLGAMVGIGGDRYIDDTSTQASDYSHVLILTAAVIKAIEIDDTDVKTTRNYDGTMPANYLICAGEGAKITKFSLTSGTAQGIIFKV